MKSALLVSIEDLKFDISSKDTHSETLDQIVSELGQLDDYAIQRICEGLKAKFAGQKGRVAGYEWMKKEKPVSIGNGKRGRPALTVEEKLHNEQIKFEKKMAELKGEVSSEQEQVG